MLSTEQISLASSLLLFFHKSKKSILHAKFVMNDHQKKPKSEDENEQHLNLAIVKRNNEPG